MWYIKRKLKSCMFEIARTPLHAAAFTDHVECLQLLLRHNAAVNVADNSGKTALMMAAENGQAGAVGMYSTKDFTFRSAAKQSRKIEKCSLFSVAHALLLLMMF